MAELGTRREDVASPISWSSRDQWCDEAQASMPIRAAHSTPEVEQPDPITSLAMVSRWRHGELFFIPNFCSRHDHIGGVTPSRPTRHARPCSVPSGCLIAAMKTFAPGLRSLWSPCT
jgi:hypothetical protein